MEANWANRNNLNAEIMPIAKGTQQPIADCASHNRPMMGHQRQETQPSAMLVVLDAKLSTKNVMGGGESILRTVLLKSAFLLLRSRF